ncbi:MAG: DUF4301 family protein [Myxococcota bacterium]
MNEWTERDLNWAQREGLALQELEEQIAIASTQQPGAELVDPCRLDQGIEGQPRPIDMPLAPAVAARITHFIPASGAASRMFKAVVEARAQGFTSEAHLADAVATGATSLAPALEAVRGRRALAVGQGIEHAELGEVLDHWLGTLTLPKQPKGLVPFHAYGPSARTAAEEQVIEAAMMGDSAHVTVHFTVPEGTGARFEAAVDRVRPALAELGRQVDLTTSVQHPVTNTVALTPEGALFRLADGTPLRRPGGHGALLRNLDALDADLVVIKNIDNVVRDDHRDDVLRWRRGLVRRLLELEGEVHAHLRALEHGASGREALEFAERHFGTRPCPGLPRERAEFALRRPLRVCGMVRNEGQPGGGPFWVRGVDGSVTPQIVESAQVDLNNPAQSNVFSRSTHFNPVDIVASLRDPDGVPYELPHFVDPTAWIIAHKSFEGRPLRALERPGLWNGSMAGWNTLFVAIPAHVFQPVKQLADLLRTGHAPLAKER